MERIHHTLAQLPQDSKNKPGIWVGLDTVKKYQYWYRYRFKKGPHRTVTFLEGTLNHTYHFEVIIH